jgi:hypothetical protein
MGAMVVAIALLSLVSASTFAAEFMGVEIDGPVVDYVVLRDVNVRAKPDTKSKRLGGLKKGEIIHSPGRFQGWVAAAQDGHPIGFAYKKYLLPMIDGGLSEPVNGNASIASGGSCTFTIHFAGKSTANNVLFKMADYETMVQCQYDGKAVQAIMFMFMTEGPMTRSKPSLHQIGMDVLEIDADDGYDDIFSTNVLYDHDKQQIKFDGVTLEGYGGKPRETAQSVTSVSEALIGAVRMALESWNDRTWKELTSSEN